jgi:ketosteroid isomerase-like protein
LTEALEQRLRRLEDMLEIQNLQASYARYADRGWPGAQTDSEALANLFTEDGVWSSPKAGTYEGRQAIREGLGRGTMPFSLHLLLSPQITFEGDEASGTWRALFALTNADGQALWGGGGYEVSYRRTAAGWRIRRLRTESAFMTPYGESWAKPIAAG